jgi:hypothetical protein
MPYFTEWFLDIDVSKNVYMNMYPLQLPSKNYGLKVHGHTTQLCMQKKLTSIRRFWVCSLFHLKIAECDATVPPLAPTVAAQTLVLKHMQSKYSQDSSQVNMWTWKLEHHTCHQSSVWDNFQTAADAPYNCSVLEHHGTENTCEDAY